VCLSVLHRFVRLINRALRTVPTPPTACPTNQPGGGGGDGALVYCVETDPAARANLAVLIAAHLLLSDGRPPAAAAAAAVAAVSPAGAGPLPAFRDATYAAAGFGLGVGDCAAGLARAVGNGWYSPVEFDAEVGRGCMYKYWANMYMYIYIYIYDMV
jgi:hypothetical protein